MIDLSVGVPPVLENAERIENFWNSFRIGIVRMRKRRTDPKYMNTFRAISSQLLTRILHSHTERPKHKHRHIHYATDTHTDWRAGTHRHDTRHSDYRWWRWTRRERRRRRRWRRQRRLVGDGMGYSCMHSATWNFVNLHHQDCTKLKITRIPNLILKLNNWGDILIANVIVKTGKQ